MDNDSYSTDDSSYAEDVVWELQPTQNEENR